MPVMDPRRLSAVAACAAAAGPLLLTGGPAGAAPLDFAPDQKLEAECTVIKTVTLVPVSGDGAFTPYLVSNGQTLVPTSFQVTSGEGLKARHLVDDKVTRPGGGQASSTTCLVTGSALDEAGNAVPFTATIVGKLTGRAVTAP
jgi:hypothetical protein